MLSELPNLFWTVWFLVSYIYKETHRFCVQLNWYITSFCQICTSVLTYPCCLCIKTSTVLLKMTDMLTTAPVQMKMIKTNATGFREKWGYNSKDLWLCNMSVLTYGKRKRVVREMFDVLEVSTLENNYSPTSGSPSRPPKVDYLFLLHPVFSHH